MLFSSICFGDCCDLRKVEVEKLVVKIGLRSRTRSVLARGTNWDVVCVLVVERRIWREEEAKRLSFRGLRAILKRIAEKV